MIPVSSGWKWGAGIAALLLHGAVLHALYSEQEIRLKGSAGSAQAKLGAGFADLVAGTISAARAGEVLESPPPPRPAPQPAADLPTPVKKQLDMAPPPRHKPDAASPAPRAPVVRATPAETEAPKPQVIAALPPQPAQSPPLSEVIRGAEPAPDMTRSPRPIARPDKPEPRPKPKAQPAPRGNAQHTQRAGSATGSDASSATRAGTPRAGGSEQGNAAVSNYPGKVMRRLSRASRPRVGVRGEVLITFTIAGNGGLAGTSVARSSGSPRLDNAALQVVRRAAPFPRPPRGAQRSFSVRIVGQ